LETSRWFNPISKARLLVTAEVAPKLNLLKSRIGF
jgi:hypothetical protein